jgi:hypothetical protein
MLREWVTNLDIRYLRSIVSDTAACRAVVWRLAYAELDRRTRTL